ncbi:MAG: hypothetical protein EXS00_06515 [Phycisphaerales bacterium]|nr:hypothetical protein [Phycisphaerales bacterium]
MASTLSSVVVQLVLLLGGAGDDGTAVDPDLVFLRAVLFDQSGADEVRLAAAARIAARGSADSSLILREALGSGNASLMAAVVDSMADGGAPARQLIDALIAALGNSPPALQGRIAAILANEEAYAAEPLMDLASRQAEPVAVRVAVIDAIGALRGDARVDRLLIGLLEEPRAECSAIRSAAIKSLERLTGMNLGDDPQAWLDWWRGTGSGQSPDAALNRVRLRLVEVERSLAAAELHAETLAARVEEFANKLSLALTSEERIRLAQRLLGDPLPEVRQAGISQFERALRNGERPDAAAQALLAQSMSDTDSAVRIRAARLLAVLGTPGLPDKLAEALAREGDGLVVLQLLDLVAVAPCADSFGPSLERLRDRRTSDAAARAIWSIAIGGFAPRGWELTVADAVKVAAAADTTAAIVRLESALAKDEAGVARAALRLGDEDAAVRRGAAEGLRHAGVVQPLLDRAAADEVVYESAVGAIADGPSSLSAMESLLKLSPRVAQEAVWNHELARLLAGLEPVNLLAADARLDGVAWVDPLVRSSALTAAVALMGSRPIDDAAHQAPGFVDQLAARAAVSLMAASRYREALTLLEGRGSEPGTPLREQTFLAAIYAGDFAAAARAVPDQRAWMRALATIAQSDASLALPLADEIRLRFAGQLSEEEADRLEAISVSLIGRTVVPGVQ